jgi:hypothetical protein
MQHFVRALVSEPLDNVSRSELMELDDMQEINSKVQCLMTY